MPRFHCENDAFDRQRRNVELLLPTLAALLAKEVLDPIDIRSGLRMRTDVRVAPPA